MLMKIQITVEQGKEEVVKEVVDRLNYVTEVKIVK